MTMTDSGWPAAIVPESPQSDPVWLSAEEWGRFLNAVHRGGFEGSLDSLIKMLSSNNCGLLEGLSWLNMALRRLDISAKPSLDTGDPTQTRLFVSEFKTTIDVPDEVAAGESHFQEFKSSFCFDRKRAKHDQAATLQDLNSDSVLRDFLKSIAGFLNAHGGKLWVGVADDGSAAGIEDDCKLWNLDPSDHDGIELRVRNLLRGNFLEDIGFYVDIDFLEYESKVIALFNVRKRSNLSYVRKMSGGDRYELFRRQGNSTSELRIHEVEEFLKERVSKA